MTTGWADHLMPVDEPGVVLIDEQGNLALADARAEFVLGRAGAALRDDWPALKRRLEAASGDDLWSRDDSLLSAELPVAGDARRIDVRVRRVAGRGHLLLVREGGAAESAAFGLRLASQMHTLSQLYRAMAHDLRGPLNTMVVNLELLADAVSPGGSGPLAERLPRYVRVMKDETQRLTRYLNAFLAGVAPPVYSERDVDMAREVPDVVEFVAAQARRQEVEIDNDLPPGELWVHGSAEDLRQALLSLLTHAIGVIPRGGTVVLGGGHEGEAIRLWIEDGGENGFDSDAAHRALEENGSSSSQEASRIGLAVARATARRLGGDLTVAEKPDDGFRFELELPAARTEES